MATTSPWWKRLFGVSSPQPTNPAKAIETSFGTGYGYSLDGMDDPSDAIRFGYMVIALGLGISVVWAIFAPLSEGIPAPGVVVVESHRKVISHMTGGTVTAVFIEENRVVKEGDVLLEFDPSRTESAYETVLHEYIAGAAKLARLKTEQGNGSKIEFPEDIVYFSRQIGREDLLRAQEQLFRARRDAFQGELAILDENLVASRIQVTGARNQLNARRQQAESLRTEIESSRPLVESGFTPRNRLLEQERQLAELTSVVSELEARIAREGSSGSEIRLRALQRKQEYLKDIEAQTTESRREVANLTERLKDAQSDLERMTVRAPISGQVVSMMAQAPGVVVPPNSKLMEIVPTDEKLLIDVKVPITAASRIKPELETDIRLSNFPEMPSLVIQGRVLSVSTDRHEPTNGNAEQPYYLARIEVTPEGLEKLEGRKLRPGMSTDVVIKTGERSFMTYLMDPISRRIFASFKEP
jgi:protease secretion system membrane fusion protein